MSKFEVIRMPKSKDGYADVFGELQPFLAAMYGEADRDLHGAESFSMEQWVFLWDTGQGMFIVSRNADGTLRAVVQCIKHRDLWYNAQRLDLYRYAFAENIEDPRAELEAVGEYAIANSGLLDIDELYITKRSYEGELRGVEIKELKWQSPN